MQRPGKMQVLQKEKPHVQKWGPLQGFMCQAPKGFPTSVYLVSMQTLKSRAKYKI